MYKMLSHFVFFISFIKILGVNHITYIACIKLQHNLFILDITDIKLQIILILHARHKKRRIFMNIQEALMSLALQKHGMLEFKLFI